MLSVAAIGPGMLMKCRTESLLQMLQCFFVCDNILLEAVGLEIEGNSHLLYLISCVRPSLNGILLNRQVL